MKNRKFNFAKIFLLIGAVLSITTGCDRDLSDDVTLANFSSTGDVFTDDFIDLGSDFYLPFSGSKLDAFSVDTEEGFESDASIRIDVPNADDPNGNFAGAIIRIDGAPRDLSGFDALTFYVRASQGVNVDAFGFGQDFLENEFQATVNNTSVSTAWNKIVIPIPDPSKLVEERGVFWYAMGTQDTGGLGYSVWIDEIRFETLGTVAQPRPTIQDGQDIVVSSFIGVNTPITPLIQTYNLGSGGDVMISTAPGYFEFESSNPVIASIDELGVITVNAAGTAVITATLAGETAQGSVTINSLGNFQLPPTPTRSPNDVFSIFSDFYTDVPIDFYNGFWEPFQTTLSADFDVNGDNILNYIDFNFVGHQFANPTLNITDKANLHFDMYIPSSVPANLDFLVSVVDFGPDNVDGGGDDTRQQIFFNSSEFVADTWSSLEVPITLTNKSNVGLIIYENVNGSSLSNFYLDNVYFFRDSVTASPNVDDSAATQVELPIGFESSLTYNFIGFEGADSAIEANPVTNGINPTATAMRSTKTNGAQFFAGTALELNAPIDFSTSQKFRMKVLSPKSGIPIRVRLENASNSVGIELDATTTTSNEWEELEWDFSSFNTAPSYVRIVVFFEFIPGLPGDGSIYYFDDIQIVN